MKYSQYRRTQTQIKHEILVRYLDTWGGIIVNGLCHSKYQHIWKFIYVDCFAYKGKYLGNEESVFQYNATIDPVYGSPIIGIRSLDKLASYAASLGVQIETNSILIEKDTNNYHDLKNTLDECGLKNRIQETSIFTNLHNGEIALLNVDVTTICDRLVTYTNIDGTWAFYLIDPFGPSGIPYDFVKKIVQCDRHDVMLNLIYEDLVRKTGMALNNELNSQHKQLVDYWRIAYGTSIWNQKVLKGIEEINDHRNWRDILDNISIDGMEANELLTDEQLIEMREKILIDSYQLTLLSMDPAIGIKLSALQFPDKDRTMLYLFLTTHDPTGALSLNKILYDAKLLEYELKYKLNTLRRIPCGQMSLWNPIENIPEQPAELRPAINEIANEIFQCLKGKCLTKKQIYMKLIDTLYFTNEIDKALKLLKRQGMLSYNGSLTHKTLLQFLE
jgi:three-Cys-motif partner protein